MVTNTARLIDKDVLKTHTRVSSWRSLAVVALMYGLTALTAWVATSVLGWWFTPIAIFLIGCFQHYLFVVHHEAAHLALHPNRLVNDFIADTLLAIPLGTRLKYYRALHMRHHKHIRDDQDPELSLLRSMLCKSMPMAVFQALTGITVLRAFGWYFNFIRQCQRDGTTKGSSLNDVLAFTAVWLPPIAISYATGWLWAFGLYWVVPMTVVYVPLLKMHSYSDHKLLSSPDESEYDRTLTRRFGPISTFVFNPLNSGEHLAHHLFASVPWYHMPSFVKHLEQNETYREESKKWLSDGYVVGKFTVLEQVVLPGAAT